MTKPRSRKAHYQYLQLKKILKDLYNNYKHVLVSSIRLLLQQDLFCPQYTVYPKRYLVYISTGNALEFYFRKLLSSPKKPRVRVRPPLQRLLKYQRDYLLRKERDYFQFTFIQNPFQRLVSIYINEFEKRREHSYMLTPSFQYYLGGDIFSIEDSFKEFALTVTKVPVFMAHSSFKPQTDLIDSTKQQLDLIGRIEYFEQDFKTLQDTFDLAPIPNEYKPISYRETDYYDLETLDKVYNYYKEDLERFDYTHIYHEIRRELLFKEMDDLEKRED